MSREVCVGLLGLGNVGSAVLRVAREGAPVLSAAGATIRVDAALVRHANRLRPDAPGVAITDSVETFFSRTYDVVVEVLGGIEPAASLVTRALEAGTPVVTANKSLLAACGDRLAAFARQRGTLLRYEASVVAGVPFLHTLGARPLAGALTSIEAILNGTSNYILTSMAEDGCSFDDALARAQALGYAEPDPHNDVSGRDAAEKLCVLLAEAGVATVAPQDIRTTPLSSVTAADIRGAAALGGVIRPVARATVRPRGIDASVGPEFLAGDHPLARVAGVLNGVLLESRFAGRLFFSGPGAGPEVTAATILDDVLEVARLREALGGSGVEGLAPIRERVAQSFRAAITEDSGTTSVAVVKEHDIACLSRS